LGTLRALRRKAGNQNMTGAPEEAPRLAKLAVAELDADQRAVYDAITGGPRAAGRSAFSLVDADGGLEGPFNAMLLHPPIGQALQALGGAVRYRSTLTDRAREIAILLVASQWDSAFETFAHEAVGRSVGLSELELTALRERRIEAFTDGYERLVAATTMALAARHDLDDQEFRAAAGPARSLRDRTGTNRWWRWRAPCARRSTPEPVLPGVVGGWSWWLRPWVCPTSLGPDSLGCARTSTWIRTRQPA
jgi:4-carboxymuconolactone decarboxylase